MFDIVAACHRIDQVIDIQERAAVFQYRPLAVGRERNLRPS